jgi:hypothetical protein
MQAQDPCPASAFSSYMINLGRASAVSTRIPCRKEWQQSKEHPFMKQEFWAMHQQATIGDAACIGRAELER